MDCSAQRASLFAYSANHMIDTDYAVIFDVEATRSVRQTELGAMQTMLDRAHTTFDIKSERMIADSAYGTWPLLEWLVQERGIALIFPSFTARLWFAKQTKRGQVWAQGLNIRENRLHLRGRE
jgi:hypothetical protein